MKQYRIKMTKCKVFMQYEFPCYDCSNFSFVCDCFSDVKKYYSIWKIKENIVDKLFINAV